MSVNGTILYIHDKSVITQKAILGWHSTKDNNKGVLFFGCAVSRKTPAVARKAKCTRGVNKAYLHAIYSGQQRCS